MQVVSNLEVGGAQEVVRTLAENLAAAGCRLVVCTFKDGPLRPKIERLGIPVEVLPDRRSSIVAFPSFMREMWQLRRALLGLVEKYDVDVVQTHLLRSLDFLVLSLRFSRRILIFWTFQNARFDLRQDHLKSHKWLLRPKRAAHHLLYRWGAEKVNGFIAVSEDVKTSILDTMWGIPAEKIRVIFNSVDIDRYGRGVGRAAVRRELGLAETDRVMSVVATFKRQKGHCYLIEAAREVLHEYPTLHILFIGDGELRETLQAQTQALGLEGHIHFLGTRSDVPALLAASDYFVLPSLWEGLSMALVEAMASRLPVIATAVSGTRQVVVPGETGLLVNPGEVQPLAAAMLYMLSNPEEAGLMGQRGRQRVEQYFSARKQATDHMSLFDQEWQLAHAAWR
jgi:glycosyltransferase involved in cell wall biosynthesis